jgi:hypothetical protein
MVCPVLLILRSEPFDCSPEGQSIFEVRLDARFLPQLKRWGIEGRTGEETSEGAKRARTGSWLSAPSPLLRHSLLTGEEIVLDSR